MTMDVCYSSCLYWVFCTLVVSGQLSSCIDLKIGLKSNITFHFSFVLCLQLIRWTMRLNDDKTRNVKKRRCFMLCKIIASQSLCHASDSLFSWWLSLNCKTAIKWVWDSSCSCRGLVSRFRSQTQKTSSDRQSIINSQTVKLVTSLLNSNIVAAGEYFLHVFFHHCMSAHCQCLCAAERLWQ